MAAEWLTLARPNSAATAMTTSSPSRYLFAKSRLTGSHLASRAPESATRASPRRHLSRGDGAGCPGWAATGRARRCGRPASRTDPAPTSRDRCSTDRPGPAAATSPTGTAAPQPEAGRRRARSLAGRPPGARARHVIRGPAPLLIFRPARALPGVRTGGPLLAGRLIGRPAGAGVLVRRPVRTTTRRLGFWPRRSPA